MIDSGLMLRCKANRHPRPRAVNEVARIASYKEQNEGIKRDEWVTTRIRVENVCDHEMVDSAHPAESGSNLPAED